MFDDNENYETLEELRQTLREAPELPIREHTLFSIGGKGYYENPTTAVLAYFMGPEGQHNLGCLFLRIFLECMAVDPNGLELDRVNVIPQLRIDGGQMDIFCVGSDWCLVIENKIRAGLTNPVETYKEFASRYSGGHAPFLAILAPFAIDEPGWVTVTYKKLCTELKRALQSTAVSSKWHGFAIEFVCHLENEIYQTSMNLDEKCIDYVESNWRNIARGCALSDTYRPTFVKNLEEQVVAEVPQLKWRVQEDSNWAVVFDTEGTLPWRMIFQLPLHSYGNPKRKFVCAVFVSGLPEPLRSKAIARLAKTMKFEFDDGEWYSEEFDDLHEARNCLMKLAKTVAELSGRGQLP